jgi:putative ABC transport system permease protein
MIANYFKTAVRFLARNKGTTFISISGLAIGIACCLLILLYVVDELSYDRYHVNANRIYRLHTERTAAGAVTVAAVSPSAHAPHLLAAFEEIESVVRFHRTQPVIANGEQRFRETRFFFADSSVLDLFTFPLIQGDPHAALNRPFSVLITEETARKYFGSDDPVGRTIRYENAYDFVVTGVLKNIPHNSHFRFDFLASFTSLQEVLSYLLGSRALNDWVASMHHTYIMLADDADAGQLEHKLPAYVQQHMGERHGAGVRLSLQPLTSIHLHSNLLGEIEPNSDIAYIYIFSIVAGIILALSCINFTNLSVAQALHRTREVGVRKVLGAARPQVIGQFLCESTVIAIVACILAVALVQPVLPFFGDLTGKNLHLLQYSWLPLSLIGLILFVGLAAGMYPAIYISGFNSVPVMKGTVQGGTRGALLRKALIVIQFTMSIVLIIGMLTAYGQLHFMRTKKLGFAKEQVVVMPLVPGLRNDFESFKHRLKEHHSILHASASSTVPGRNPMTQTCRAEGLEEGESVFFPNMIVDHDFLGTYGLELIEGRSFSRSIATDDTEAFILNETAVRKLGWGSAVGREFEVLVENPTRKGRVIGVVMDFHFRSLHREVQPLVLRIQPFWYRTVSVRISPDDIPGTIDELNRAWREFVPDRPFEYTFLDEEFNRSYRSEERFASTLNAFAGVALFIACLGLYGLMAFMSERRTKEIGIRKVLGATSTNVVSLLSKETLILIAVACIIAWPVAYTVTTWWLQNFAYRTEIEPGIYVLAAVLAQAIACATISYHAIRAATANPVQALRYE